MIAKKPEELWITNISMTQDISLGDLRITVRSGRSLNLLAKSKKGKPLFNLTRKQIDDSILSGSIAKKSKFIKVRKVAPVVFNHQIDQIDIAQVTSRESVRLKRKATEIEIPEYSDLDFEDDENLEKYAAQNADMDFADRMPILAVDPKFKKPTVDDD